MAKLSKLERAKKVTREKFRGILKDLPKMSHVDFGNAIIFRRCGFCVESRWCRECLFGFQCDTMVKRLRVIRKLRYWRKPVAELCEWILEEVDKVKEG